MRTFGQILIGIILGALVGGGCMWAYIAYSDYRQEQKELAQQEMDQRQAHKDSLMRIRAMQDEHLQVEEKVEAERQLMCEYLTTFYREEIFGDHRSHSSTTAVTPSARTSCLTRVRSSRKTTAG